MLTFPADIRRALKFRLARLGGGAVHEVTPDSCPNSSNRQNETWYEGDGEMESDFFLGSVVSAE